MSALMVVALTTETMTHMASLPLPIIAVVAPIAPRAVKTDLRAIRDDDEAVMKETYDEVAAGLRRGNALLTWWGAPEADWNREGAAQMTRFRQLTSDLQQACQETCGRQLDIAVATSNRLAQSFQALARSRHPREVTAMEFDILATLLEAASSHAKYWADLTQRLQDSCAAIARETAEDLQRQAAQPIAASAPADSERQPQSRSAADHAYA